MSLTAGDFGNKELFQLWNRASMAQIPWEAFQHQEGTNKKFGT